MKKERVPTYYVATDRFGDLRLYITKRGAFNKKLNDRVEVFDQNRRWMTGYFLHTGIKEYVEFEK